MLTQEQKAFYKENGYLVVEGVLSQAELKLLHETIDELVEKAQSLGVPNNLCDFEPVSEGSRKIVRRIFNPFEQARCFEELASHKVILDAVEDLIGPNIQIHHSKLNMKPARAGSPVKWHQDLPFFPHTNTDLVACLIHLNDSTLENGCLRVIPGSHKLGPLDHRSKDGTFIGMVTDDLKKVDMNKAVNLPLKAGGMVLLHCLTLHSSAPNTSEAGRRVLIYEYRASDSMQLYGTPNNYMGRILRGVKPTTVRLEEITYIIPNYPIGTNIYDLQANYNG
jgi:ectoine hydroxylase-related dioxygenase (phytanoyl-CoA dioxygenase family)